MPAVLQEHEAKIVRLANDVRIRTVLGSEQGAILGAGLTETEPLERPASYSESTTVRNDDGSGPQYLDHERALLR